MGTQLYWLSERTASSLNRYCPGAGAALIASTIGV